MLREDECSEGAGVCALLRAVRMDVYCPVMSLFLPGPVTTQNEDLIGTDRFEVPMVVTCPTR
jgi:hypothetical protein